MTGREEDYKSPVTSSRNFNMEMEYK